MVYLFTEVAQVAVQYRSLQLFQFQVRFVIQVGVVIVITSREELLVCRLA